MSPIAARKFAAIVENLERVLAIEAIAAFQAMEFLRPLVLVRPIERCGATSGASVRPWNRDREMHVDLENARALPRRRGDGAGDRGPRLSGARRRAGNIIRAMAHRRPRRSPHGPRRPRHRAALPRLGPGSRPADAREQPRPGQRREARELIVYGGTGRAARNWECFDSIVATLKRLEANETMLVQSGKAVGVFETHEDAPRVLISNSMLVPAWATGDEFRRLEGLGLTMYGQMTAGSWIYIGSQGIVQGTFETFAAAGRRQFGGDLAGRLVVTAGLGGMGGAQPLAATMNGAVALVAEVDPERIEKRLRTRYLDEQETDVDRAIDRALAAKDARRAVSIGVEVNAVDLLERLLARGIVPDLVTDQTSAHDELNGYVPRGGALAELGRLRREDPARYIARAYATMADHMRALLELQRRGAVVFDYGNNLRGQAQKAGVDDAFQVGGFVPLYIRPLFCEGKGPFRWAALSGDPEDIRVTDRALLELFPQDAGLAPLADPRRGAHRVPGPAGADLLARLRRAAPRRACSSTSSSGRGR